MPFQEPQGGIYLVLLALAICVIVPYTYMLGRRVARSRSPALTDALTGLANRAQIEARLGAETIRTTKRGNSLSILFIDIDDLKVINETWGREACDATLKLTADTLRQTCRATDLAGRWDDDEFVVIAPGASSADALQLAHRIRAALSSKINLSGDALLPAVCVSIGVADTERLGVVDGAGTGTSSSISQHAVTNGHRDRVALARRDSSRIDKRREVTHVSATTHSRTG